VKPELFIKRSRIDAPTETVFAWHKLPGALERLTPPWEHVQVLEDSGSMENGARVVLVTKLGPFRLKWVAEHRDYREGRQFRDVQVTGPFALWNHTHCFEADGPQACWLEDRIEYALPGGYLGRLLGGRMARKRLERLFDYRHRVTAEQFTKINP
jgi:ligand-binding SRPBCC domain-containing protein